MPGGGCWGTPSRRLVPEMSSVVTHTVPHDLRKLAALKKPHANHVGYLLLGFDSVADPMVDDIRELATLARLDAAPWTAFTASWPDAYRSGNRVHVWLWTSDVM